MLGDTPRHTQTYPDIIGYAMIIACRRARREGWSARAGEPVAGSRAVGPVAGSRIACDMARRSLTSRHIPVHLGDLTSLPCSRSGEPKARRLPCPGPTWRCSRRRHRRYTNIYSFTWPWRFIVARSAARLSAIVGPLSPRHTVPNRPGSRKDRASPRINGDNRT